MISGNNAEKRKSPGISWKRIVIVLVIVAIPVALFLILDNYVERLECYCDLNPLWLNDGQDIIFIRWYLVKGICADHMELWRARMDGSNPRLVYRFDRKFIFYGIRFSFVTPDGKYFIARVSQKDLDYEYQIKDFLYKIPLDGIGETEIWQLEKESGGDIILAFQNDTALVRREGGKDGNKLVFTDFPGRTSISTHSYPEDKSCSSAVLFDDGTSALVIVGNLHPEHEKYLMYRLDRRDEKNLKIAPLDTNLISPLFLPKKRVFISINKIKSEFFYVIDENLEVIRKIRNPVFSPAEEALLCELTVSPDEQYILHSNDNSIYRIDINTGKYERIDLAVKVVPTIHQNLGGDKLMFSNGQSVFVFLPATGSLTRVSELSARHRIEKNPFMGKFINFRDILIWSLYRRIFGEDVCSD